MRAAAQKLRGEGQFARSELSQGLHTGPNHRLRSTRFGAALRRIALESTAWAIVTRRLGFFRSLIIRMRVAPHFQRSGGHPPPVTKI